MLYTPLTRKVMKYCFEAHDGQLDKSGIPYVNHPLHLAEQMETEDETVVALLHDVMEDCGKTPDDLRALGISERAVEALVLLTHEQGVPYLDYVRAIKDNPLAVTVKLADLQHNSDLTRLDDVRGRDIERLCKYREARAELGAAMTPREENAQMIDVRIEAGLSLLRKHYAVSEQAVDEALANPVIGGRPHHARRFDIESVGNLLVMTVKNADENQLSTFVITPMSASRIRCCAVYCSSGRTAIHSITSTSAFCAAARLRIAICSRIFALPLRRTGSSLPSTSIVIGSVPVVLQKTRSPPARSPASIIRLTEDLPRVPFTCTT